jgi:hypothetical protein
MSRKDKQGTLNNIDIDIDIIKGVDYIQSTMREQIGACPLCGGEMFVAEYSCTDCGVTLKGHFKRCDLCNLPKELLHFVRVFLKSEGNIKEVERVLGLSYPTVKARLAKVNQTLSLGDFSEYMKTQERLELLEDFKEGKLSLEELLKRI